MESSWIWAALWLPTNFPARMSDAAHWIPRLGGRLAPFQHCLPGTASYIMALAALAYPAAGVAWDRAPARGPWHLIAVCIQGGTNLPCQEKARTHAQRRAVPVSGAGAPCCNLSSCQLKLYLGFLMSREFSVSQEFTVFMNSRYPDTTKNRNRVKTQVLVSAHLSSGFLKWANTTAPAEPIQKLLEKKGRGTQP